MKHYVLWLIYVLVVAASTSSCAEAPSKGTHLFYQSISVGNRGARAVHDVSINYNGRVFPSGTLGRTITPGPSVRASESWVLAIPEEVEILWTSDDGQHHRVVAPLHRFVPNEGAFLGTNFSFVDDHVDVYVESRKPTKSRFLDADITKVYSSPIVR